MKKRGPLSARLGKVGRNVFPTEETTDSESRCSFLKSLRTSMSERLSESTAEMEPRLLEPLEPAEDSIPPLPTSPPPVTDDESADVAGGSGDIVWNTPNTRNTQKEEIGSEVPSPRFWGAGEGASSRRSEMSFGGMSEYPASSRPFTPGAIHPDGELRRSAGITRSDPVELFNLEDSTGEQIRRRNLEDERGSLVSRASRASSEFSVVTNVAVSDDTAIGLKLRKLFEVPADPLHQPTCNSLRLGRDYDDEDGLMELVTKLYYKNYVTNASGGQGVSYRVLLGATIDRIFDFVNIPAPPGFNVKCRLVRRKEGVEGSFCPQYYMFIERPGESDIFLMTARKRRSAFSSYVISTNPAEMRKDSQYCIGILNGNFKRSKFNLYSPVSAYDHFEGDSRPPATQLLSISFENEDERLGSRNPRMLRVAAPKLKDDFLRMNYTDKKVKIGDEDFIQLRNREPMWSQSSGTFVLNFHQRVTESSIKNFILCPRDAGLREHNCLLFGKTANDKFSLDFAYPLCPLQAFAIALASFDVKWGIE